MKRREFLLFLLFCLMLTGCRTDPIPPEETPAGTAASAAVSASAPAAPEQNSGMDGEPEYNAEEVLKGIVSVTPIPMSPPPWLPHSRG